MGYETRLHIVRVYDSWGNTKTGQKTGESLAVISMCKCGYDGPFYQLWADAREKIKKGKGKSFALYPLNPERNYEAVELLREIAEEDHWACDGRNDYKPEKIQELSNDIEDGYILTDKYGDPMPIADIDDVIDVLKKELDVKEPYRRFQWALDILESIKKSSNPMELEQIKVVAYGY